MEVNNQQIEYIENTTEKHFEDTVSDTIENVIESDLEDTVQDAVENTDILENEAENIEPNSVPYTAESIQEDVPSNLIENQIEEPHDNQLENETKKLIRNYKKIAIFSIIFICTLLVIYFGIAGYFMNRFYFGSEINCINVSGKTVEDAKKLMASELHKYSLTLKEQGGKSEQIKAADFGLKYSLDEDFNEIEKLKDRQNPFSWILACFNMKESKMTVGISYDEKLLKEKIDNLPFFDSKNIIEPKNPSFQYVDNSYVIVDEVLGNKVDKDILYSCVVDSIIKGKTELDLESSNCYIRPKYNSKSDKTNEIKDTLNKYVSSKITYIYKDNKKVIDGSIINKWLVVNENFEITFDSDKVKEYIKELSKTYNTIGKTRSFAASTGKTINVSGGDYGSSINKAKETESLLEAIKEGQTITREPIFGQTTFSNDDNDIGNTYVEINLEKQHLWFYKNGSLIVEGDVVTGNVKKNHTTPKGIYRLKYKQKNAVLRGPDYESPVTFWLPFNGGIGIHDASWRRVFGGNIYETNGSHGCINAPYSVAKNIFYNIEPGTPVICY